MKRSVHAFAYALAFVLTTALVFYSCSRENDPGFNQDPKAIENIELMPQYSEEAVDEIFPDDGGNDDIYAQYCLYSIAEVLESHSDPALHVGDILCYQCPDNGTCIAATKMKRKIRVTYTSGVIEDYTVTISGNAGNCKDCPPGGKRVNQTLS